MALPTDPSAALGSDVEFRGCPGVQGQADGSPGPQGYDTSYRIYIMLIYVYVMKCYEL